jgi:hypothetical protein
MLGFMCETEVEGTGEERCWKKDGGWRRARIICKQSLVGSSVIGCRECGLPVVKRLFECEECAVVRHALVWRSWSTAPAVEGPEV